MVLTCLATIFGVAMSRHAAAGDEQATAAVAKAPASAAPSTVSGPAAAEAVDAAVAGAVQGAAGNLTIGVLDLATGRSTVAGDDHSYVTASIVKVDILATLLLQAQDDGQELDATQRQQAEAMIQASDNAAADALWTAIGGHDALATANRAFGLTATVPGQGGQWGLTTTTASDQLTLLQAVFGGSSPLTAASRDYLRELMGNVVDGQDWGVSAAATGSTGAAEAKLKNGWLPRSDTGLWVINSIGQVPVDGRSVLVAALSDDQPDKATGIAVVEKAAKAATRALIDSL